MDDYLIIESIALAPIISGIIEVAKRLGLPVKYAPWMNAGLSVLGFILIIYLKENPTLTQPVTIGLNALVIFLTTAGFYDRAKAILTNSSPPSVPGESS
jgi:hypothetical protein